MIPHTHIILRKPDEKAGTHYLVLGSLSHMMLVALEVECIRVPRTNHQVFLTGAGVVRNRTPTLLAFLNLDHFSIVPAAHYPQSISL